MRSAIQSFSPEITSLQCAWGSKARIDFAFLIIAILSLDGDYCFCQALSPDSIRFIGSFNKAVSFSLTPSGTFFVVDQGSSELIRLNLRGVVERRVGGYGWKEGGLDHPVDLCAPNEIEIYVADRGNNSIVRFDKTLGIASIYETNPENGSPGSSFRFPLSVALTGSGKLLVVDGENGRIVEIDKNGQVSRAFGGPGSGAGFLKNPVRVRIDPADNVFVHHDKGIAIFDVYGNYLRTMEKALIGGFSTFNLFRDRLILLDSTEFRVVSEKGIPIDTIALPLMMKSQGKKPIDIQADGNFIFVLYPGAIAAVKAVIPHSE